MKESNSISENFLNKGIEKESEEIYSDISLKELEAEIELISDPNIKKFVRYLLRYAPGFWKAPGSQTPGIHPPDEELFGGLVLHTKRVVRVAMVLSMTIESDNQTEFDCFIAAAILHDISKFMVEEDTGEFIYDAMHPYTVDRYVEWARQESMKESTANGDNALDIDVESLGLILRLIRCSHGIWSPIPETIPISNLEKALHEADLLAANLHIIIDGQDIKEERWLI